MKDGKVMINNATVPCRYYGDNGVVHVIDTVILSNVIWIDTKINKAADLSICSLFFYLINSFRLGSSRGISVHFSELKILKEVNKLKLDK